MNRRSFLKWVGASAAAAVLPLPLPALAAPKKLSIRFPFLNIIQPLSLAAGAGWKPGQLMNTKTKQVYDSIEFVPCYTEHVYTEWGAGPGAYVGAHGFDSSVVLAARLKDVSEGSFRFKTPAGNVLVETYYLYGLQVKGDKVVTPCVLSFSGAKIKSYKNFLSAVMRSKGRPPMFAYKLRISTVPEHNRHGSFFNYQIRPAKGSFRWIPTDTHYGGHWDVGDTLLPPDHPLLKAAVKLRKQVIA